jgi:hypothetical protein
VNATSPAAGEEPALIYYPASAAKSGGIKATWHLEIVTGKDAAALLEMQNQAIIDLLNWVVEHEKAVDHNSGDHREICANDSRETLELAA